MVSWSQFSGQLSHGVMSRGRTGTDDACVENRQVLLACGEGSDGKGAAGLRAATDTPLWRRTR